MSTFFNWFNSSGDEQEPSLVPIKKRYTNENIEEELNLVRQVKDATDRLYKYLLEESAEQSEQSEQSAQSAQSEPKTRKKRKTEVEMLEAQFSGWKK